MQELIYCVDSGTTSIKAAAIDSGGRIVALSEQPNKALLRKGECVEQDMHVTLSQAMHVLRDCVDQTPTARPCGLILTGQGEGLWPVDKAGTPLGPAMTWLDARAATLTRSPALQPALDEVARITGSRPTAASPSLQLLWFKQHRPEMFARISKVLRSKEWLFQSLTQEAMSEPSTAVLSWGDWHTRCLEARIPDALGLGDINSLLPPMHRTSATARPLCHTMASKLGLPQGLPVFLGPSDVQTTAIGLGVGVLPDVNRASIFGTSAVHVGHFSNVEALPVQRPSGAMFQPSSICEKAYFCIFPGLNGTTAFRHLNTLMQVPSQSPEPQPSSALLHPFFEPGGERAPISDPLARAALLGLTAENTPEELAWAAREALAFNARMSHDAMGAFHGRLSFGGGLTHEHSFGALLATAMRRLIWRPPSSHSGLTGLALIAYAALNDESPETLSTQWFRGHDDTTHPSQGSYGTYLQSKYQLHVQTLALMQPLWQKMEELRALARTSRDEMQCP